MPNSAWAETASSLTLSPTTTTVNAGSSTENVNYLTNSDKILLMQQYNAELATQTQLDSTAKGLGVPSTNYDNAVANINTTLVNAGAPSNWASIWPDGTTSGPWPGIQNSLASDWTGIATARAELQTSISNTQASQQAATAESNAVAQAAASAASIYATTIQSPAVVSALPTLPNSDYPNQKIVWNTADGQLYQNNNGTWKALTVQAPNISGTLSAAQIASVAASQVTGQLTAAQIASIEAAQVTGELVQSQMSSQVQSAITATLPNGGSGGADYIAPGALAMATIRVAIPEQATASWVKLGTWVTTANSGNGTSLKIECHTGAGFNTGSGQQSITDILIRSGNCTAAPNISGITSVASGGTIPISQVAAAATGGSTATGNNSWDILLNLTSFANGFALVLFADGDSFTYSGATGQTAPVAGTTAVIATTSQVVNASGNLLGQAIEPASITTNQIAAGTIQASNIAANTITGANIAAGTITGNELVAGTITAGQIAAETITAAQIAAGTITTAQIAAGTIQASNIAAATITGAQIAAQTITASNIASQTITANQIETGTITAGQIAAGAIGATQIAAGAVVASKITITDTTNICGNPSGDTGTDNWSGDSPLTTAFNSGNPGGGYFFLVSNRDNYYGGSFPVNPGETYYFTAECAPWTSPQGSFNLGFQMGSDPNFAASPTWSPAATAQTTQSGWQTISGQLTVPAGYTFARIWVQINATPGSTGSWAFQSLIVRKAASGELLVDGSITASKIAAGAITADMITTGTLNAAQVNVTNLDASNITAGTLSATMVLFPDGSELSTASRVTSTNYPETATAMPTVTGVPGVEIPGWSFGVTTSAAANDVYNLTGNLFVDISPNSGSESFVLSLYVDGSLKQSITFPAATAGAIYPFPFFMFVSGLASGSHTLTFYLGTQTTWGGSGASYPIAQTSSNVVCQRFY